MKNFLLTGKKLLPIFLLFQTSLLASDLVLKARKTHLVESPNKKYWYDRRIDLEITKAIYAVFATADGIPQPEIYSVPETSQYFLVSAYQNSPTAGDCGRHLFLVREKGKEIFITDRTHGCGDSVTVSPSFYFNDGKILILGEVFAEDGFWGYEIYQILGGKILDLGSLDVYVDNLSLDVATAPLPAKVISIGNGWRIEFKDNLILEIANQSKRNTTYKHLRRNGKSPIVFDFDGRMFKLKDSSCEVISEEKRSWTAPNN